MLDTIPRLRARYSGWRCTAGTSPHFFCNCEQVSGKPEDRPGLASCLNALHEGDTLAVWKLDRLVRDLRCVIGSTRDMT